MERKLIEKRSANNWEIHFLPFVWCFFRSIDDEMEKKRKNERSSIASEKRLNILKEM